MKIAIVVNSAWAAYNFRSNLATGFEYAAMKLSLLFLMMAIIVKSCKKNFNAMICT